MFAVIGNKRSLLCLSSAVRTGRKRRNVSRSTFSSVIFRQKARFSRRPKLQFQNRCHIFAHIFFTGQKRKHQNEPCFVLFCFFNFMDGYLASLRCIDKGSRASGELLTRVCGWKRLTVDELLWSDRLNLGSRAPERWPSYRPFPWTISHSLGTFRALQTKKSVILSKNIPFMYLSVYMSVVFRLTLLW